MAGRIEDVAIKYEGYLTKLPNVVGVGLGERGGKPVIKVLVTRNLAASDLEPDQIAPRVLEGYETDVEEVGGVRELS
jgi:hypothetical protein